MLVWRLLFWRAVLCPNRKQGDRTGVLEEETCRIPFLCWRDIFITVHNSFTLPKKQLVVDSDLLEKNKKDLPSVKCFSSLSEISCTLAKKKKKRIRLYTASFYFLMAIYGAR
jgi:hypothetical protein